MGKSKHSKVKTVLGLTLLLVAIALFISLAPIGFFVGIIYSSFKWELGEYFKDIAIAIDQGGNVVLRHLLNMSLIKSKDPKWCFGNEDDTISCVLGRNQRDKNLSNFGKIICNILDLIDKDHCKNSIVDYVIKENMLKSKEPINILQEKTGALSFLRQNIVRLKENRTK